MKFCFEILINTIKEQLVSSINELSGNNFSKSQSCAIMTTDSLDSLVLSDPFLT